MTNTRKLIGAAAFSAALAGGGITGALLGTPGTSGAQESTTSTTVEAEAGAHGHGRGGPRGAHLEAAAEALGMTVDELRTALQDGQTMAEIAGAAGIDVDALIDTLVADATEDLRERITAVVNGEAPVGGRFGEKLDAAATALGVTVDELRAALRDGQTMAEIAGAEGVEVQTVIDALVEAGVPAERAEALVNGEARFRHRGGPRP